jgi:hypothetical protein
LRGRGHVPGNCGGACHVPDVRQELREIDGEPGQDDRGADADHRVTDTDADHRQPDAGADHRVTDAGTDHRQPDGYRDGCRDAHVVTGDLGEGPWLI